MLGLLTPVSTKIPVIRTKLFFQSEESRELAYNFVNNQSSRCFGFDVLPSFQTYMKRKLSPNVAIMGGKKDVVSKLLEDMVADIWDPKYHFQSEGCEKERNVYCGK